MGKEWGIKAIKYDLFCKAIAFKRRINGILTLEGEGHMNKLHAKGINDQNIMEYLDSFGIKDIDVKIFIHKLWFERRMCVDRRSKLNADFQSLCDDIYDAYEFDAPTPKSTGFNITKFCEGLNQGGKV